MQKVLAEVFEEICLQVVKLLGKALPTNKSLQIFQFPSLGNIKASCKIAMPCVQMYKSTNAKNIHCAGALALYANDC